MSINSKTDRFGIDVVIESLQQYSEPNLLAKWSNIAIADYTSYPRANKNFKESDVIPEISIDQSEYNDVLFNDDLAVTSFWVVSDIRNFSQTTKQIKASVSIVFQANLVKVYAQTNRADEEFNAAILDIFRKDNFYINSDIEIIEGVSNVYSDFNFSEDIQKNINSTDLSSFHVVKLSFDVIYDPTCFPTLAAICPSVGTPVSTTFNGTPTGVTTPDGSTLLFNVVNSEPANKGTLSVNTSLEKKVTLPDTDYSVVVNGGTPVLSSLATLKTETINIAWI